MSIEVVVMPGCRPYPPRMSVFTRTFWEGLSEGRLLTTRGVKSARLSFPPRPFCPHGWEREVEWVELAGTGILYSYTVVHVAPEMFAQAVPYRLAIVDLDEGLRLAAGLIGNGPARLDAPARAITLAYDDGPLLAFAQG
jgi:uncharacterized OB-fold protein